MKCYHKWSDKALNSLRQQGCSDAADRIAWLQHRLNHARLCTSKTRNRLSRVSEELMRAIAEIGRMKTEEQFAARTLQELKETGKIIL